ncbi:class I lanthipeptide [Chitinophaga vietnamensis]|uniref:class I lanthipeptide n=1 Tax=Chitinophaga vietnamensis TaxID=2593957 RepID=UPI0011778C42|nr:class I lanthipeptide [Chitinophaga vietnamensis]
MKKKRLPLEKKLFLGKAHIASLNTQQQSAINGGAAFLTRFTICTTTQTAVETCSTIPPGQDLCVAC